jgi:hypothetical protein
MTIPDYLVALALTLTAIAGMFSGRPGCAFGLPCLALIAGAMPTFTPLPSPATGPWFVTGIISISAGALLAGLAGFRRFAIDAPQRLYSEMGVPRTG